jgi:hypothetical protein
VQLRGLAAEIRQNAVTRPEDEDHTKTGQKQRAGGGGFVGERGHLCGLTMDESRVVVWLLPGGFA